VLERGCEALRQLLPAGPGEANDASAASNGICQTGGIVTIVAAMHTHPRDAALQQVACRTLFQLAHNTANAVAIVAAGGMEAVAAVMLAHKADVTVQRYGSGVLRNRFLGEDPELQRALAACGLEDDGKGSIVEALRARARKHHEALVRAAGSDLARRRGRHRERLSALVCELGTDVVAGGEDTASIYSSELWAVCGLRCAKCNAPGSTVTGMKCLHCGDSLLGKDETKSASVANANHSEPPPPPPHDAAILPSPDISDFHTTCP
jgi:hypothetical protein